MTKPGRRKQQTWGWLGAVLIAGSLTATAAGTGLLIAREETARAAATVFVSPSQDAVVQESSGSRLQLQLDLPPIPHFAAPSFATPQRLAPFARSRSSR